MNQQEIKTEIGVVASIIALNMFDAIHMSVSPEDGVIGAHYRISEIAQDFVKVHKKVKDWDEFSSSIGCLDFEDVVLKYAKEKVLMSVGAKTKI